MPSVQDAIPPESPYWVHNLDPFLIAFPESFPLEGIRWYGLAYLAGFLVAAALLHLYYKKGRSPLGPDQQTTLLTALIVGTLLGGRIGYMLFYDFASFIQNPLRILQVWQGGMASHGGMIGILLAILWFARRQKLPFWRIADLAITLGPPGILFGRIANFINAELVGKPAEVAWAVIFPIHDYYGNIIAYTQPSHPSQLYAALLEGLILTLYTQWRFWKSSILEKHPGQLSAEFLIAYGILRIIGELFRLPDASLILGLSRGTFYSLIMVTLGIVLACSSRKKNAA